ncbi:MAG: sensor domain-containing diguanylate cyclase [Myxococcales bacterium]|nr:sensor domain-containing diguanylate cyclase [Myxococcales bacterium]
MAKQQTDTVLHLGTVLMLTYLPMALFAVGIAAMMPLLITALDARADEMAIKLSNPEMMDAMRSYSRFAELPFLFATGVAGLFAALGAFTTYWARNHLEARIRTIAEYIESIGGTERPQPLRTDVTDSIGRLARDMERIAQKVRDRDVETRIEADRQKFEAQLQSGLTMAHQENDVLHIVQRAINQVGPGRPTQLMLVDSDEDQLREATTTTNAPSPLCPVQNARECIAVRRGHFMSFENGESLDACPKLLEREHPAARGVCVPLGIMGNTVGILHATSQSDDPFSAEQEEMYRSIARNVASRLGMIRALQSSQEQAETDPLTGLINRRSLDEKFQILARTKSHLSLVMCDLDHFKRLNDTYGHKAGDGALRLFAEVIQKLIRPVDLASRFGGEEFVIVYPETTSEQATVAVERIRTHLASALQDANIPSFTASFGIASSAKHGKTFSTLADAADQAMYRAKVFGRDRIVLADSPQEDSTPQAEGCSPLTAEIT